MNGSISLKNNNKYGGFTLIELIVVLIIIGVVFVVSFPRLSGLMSGRKLMGETAQLAARLDYIRSRAVAERKVYKVEFNTGEDKYRVSWQGDTEVEERKWQTLPDFISIKRIKQETTNYGRGQSTISFFPRGNSTGAEIELETERGDRASILVKTYTGRCAVEREE